MHQLALLMEDIARTFLKMAINDISEFFKKISGRDR